MPVRWGPEGDANSKDFMVVGASTNSTPDGFYGYAHAVRLYNRELAFDEISKNYAIDKLRFNLTAGGGVSECVIIFITHIITAVYKQQSSCSSQEWRAVA